MNEAFNQLEDLTTKIKHLTSLQLDHHTRPVGYAREYDLFMEFIGVYEDTKKKVLSMPLSIEKKRLERKLESFWSEHGYKI